MDYEVVYYNGWQDAPAYYIVGSVNGINPEIALAQKIEEIVLEVRKIFGLSEDLITDKFIQNDLYVLRPASLVSVEKALAILSREKNTLRQSSSRG